MTLKELLRNEGKLEGKLEAKQEDARKMKEHGIAPSVISEVTGLTEAEIALL